MSQVAPELDTIIFDLDGVLANTERLHFESYREAFREVRITFSEDEHFDHWVRRGGSLFEFIEEKGLSIDAQKLRDKKQHLFLTKLDTHDITVHGVRKFISSLKGKLSLCICTSSNWTNCNAILDKLGLNFCFDAVVTADDVDRTKPDPTCFRKALYACSSEASRCIVIEDALKGVLAANAIGCSIIVIDPNEGRWCVNATVVPSFRSLSIDFVRKQHRRQQTAGLVR